MSNGCVFRYILTNTLILEFVPSKSPVHSLDAKFLFPHRYKIVPSVYNKNACKLCEKTVPKFEAKLNYIPPSPPNSMKKCNKSATVKFHMELLLTTTRKQSRCGVTQNKLSA